MAKHEPTNSYFTKENYKKDPFKEKDFLWGNQGLNFGIMHVLKDDDPPTAKALGATFEFSDFSNQTFQTGESFNVELKLKTRKINLDYGFTMTIKSIKDSSSNDKTSIDEINDWPTFFKGFALNREKDKSMSNITSNLGQAPASEVPPTYKISLNDNSTIEIVGTLTGKYDGKKNILEDITLEKESDLVEGSAAVLLEQAGWYKENPQTNESTPFNRDVKFYVGTEYFTEIGKINGLTFDDVTITENNGDILVDTQRYTFYNSTKQVDLDNGPGWFRNEPTLASESKAQLPTFKYVKDNIYFSDEKSFKAKFKIEDITDPEKDRGPITIDGDPWTHYKNVPWATVENGGYYKYDENHEIFFSKDSSADFSKDNPLDVVYSTENQTKFFTTEKAFKDYYKITDTLLPSASESLNIDENVFTKYNSIAGQELDNPGCFKEKPTQKNQSPDKTQINPGYKYTDKDNNIYYYTDVAGAIEKANPFIEKINKISEKEDRQVVVDGINYNWHANLEGSSLTNPGYFVNQPQEDERPPYEESPIFKETDLEYFTDIQQFLDLNQWKEITDPTYVDKNNLIIEDFKKFQANLPEPKLGSKITVDGTVYTGTEEII